MSDRTITSQDHWSGISTFSLSRVRMPLGSPAGCPVLGGRLCGRKQVCVTRAALPGPGRARRAACGMSFCFLRKMILRLRSERMGGLEVRSAHDPTTIVLPVRRSVCAEAGHVVVLSLCRFRGFTRSRARFVALLTERRHNTVSQPVNGYDAFASHV